MLGLASVSQESVDSIPFRKSVDNFETQTSESHAPKHIHDGISQLCRAHRCAGTRAPEIPVQTNHFKNRIAVDNNEIATVCSSKRHLSLRYFKSALDGQETYSLWNIRQDSCLQSNQCSSDDETHVHTPHSLLVGNRVRVRSRSLGKDR